MKGKSMRIAGILLGGLLLSASAGAASLDALTRPEMVGGLKEALSKGSVAAVRKLGRENGFFGNERVKIPLPPALARIEKPMRILGMGQQADELILSMNRAAEMAVPEAKALLLDAVRGMSIEDAKGILTGGDDAATAYFKKTTEARLTQKFLPIVKKVTEKTGLARSYNNYVAQAARLGLVEEKQASIESYVTRKALDALYATIAEEERGIRQNPLEYGGKLIGKVFGALK
jgi:hypothetical protein